MLYAAGCDNTVPLKIGGVQGHVSDQSHDLHSDFFQLHVIVNVKSAPNCLQILKEVSRLKETDD